MKKLILNNQGTAVLLATLILASTMIVSFSMADIVLKNLKITSIAGRTHPAYLAAESGVERILWESRKNNENDISIDAGTGEVTFLPDPPGVIVFTDPNTSLQAFAADNGNNREVRVRGYYHDAQRRLLVIYQKSN